MPEVLRLEVDPTATRTLSAPGAVLDPTTAALLDGIVQAETARAYRDGEVAGRAAAGDAARQAATAVVEAIGHVHAELAAQRAEAARASLELARTLAVAVLDRTPPDEALTVLDRVEAALEVLDEEPLDVRVHPDIHVALAETSDPRVRIVADPTVQPGDARISGRTCGAELTRTALLSAALEVLGEGAV